MVPPASATARFVTSLRRELAVAALVGVPALAYVFATNETASRPLILLHGLVLFSFVPVCVSLGLLVLPSGQSARVTGRPVLGSVLARSAGLLLAVAAMAVVLERVTGLPLDLLVGRPLAVALVPVFLAYALIAVAVHWAALREYALRAEANEARARQAALTARIRPHFLFNALNCIEQLTDTDPPAARLAVGRLARLLRAVLDASERPGSPLASELSLVDDYLGIEQIRFGPRFQYALNVEPGVERFLVPSTVLLTLAENAIKHGVERVAGAARVMLRATRRADENVHITLVSPRAPASSAVAERGSGYGLTDVRERLALVYGERATVALEEREGEVHAELSLPGA